MWLWTSGKLVGGKTSGGAEKEGLGMAAYLSDILPADSVVCVDQTCSETQLDPQALIHQADEYTGSHSKENGLDSSLSFRPFSSLVTLS